MYLWATKFKNFGKEDDSSLILCLDTSESMSDSYQIDETLSEKFNKIRGNIIGNIITHNITRL